MVEILSEPLPTLRVQGAYESVCLAAKHVVCSAPRSGPGREEPTLGPRIMLPRRGVFMYHIANREEVADSNAAFLLDDRDICRVSHPTCEGDASMVLVPAGEVLEDVFGVRRGLERT